MPRSVLVVDDHRSLRDGLRRFFASCGWSVVGEAEDGRKAIQKAAALRPDLVVLDFLMPTLNGIETALLLKRISPEVQIILFTMVEGLGVIDKVDAVVSKAEGPHGLMDAIQNLGPRIETNRGSGATR